MRDATADRAPADATDDRIRALYIDGRHTDREIGEALGIHRVTVTRRRLAMGVSRADRKPARICEERDL
jgi:hypothetical protein